VHIILQTGRTVVGIKANAAASLSLQAAAHDLAELKRGDDAVGGVF